MSLNGLDDPSILEAYHATSIEPGGWFLLDYVLRDSVKLLAKGKAGVAEARNAIIAYSEPSPLYGLLVYRRRKVLIKYIPGNITRLLLARTTVHFQDIIDRFSPYETLIEIATGEALNDTSLAAAFPLHTASPSASSTRLHEISEDGEDTGAAAKPMPGVVTSAQRLKLERRVDQIMKADLGIRPASSLYTPRDSNRLSALPPPSAIPSGKTSISQYLVRDESGHTSITPLQNQVAIAGASENGEPSAPSAPVEGEGDPETRGTHAPLQHGTIVSSATSKDAPSEADTASLEPSISESMLHEHTDSLDSLPKTVASSDSQSYKDDYDFSEFDKLFQPKVKLGPRPVAAGERTKRPTVASIAGVPAQFRPSPKKRQARSQVGLRPPSSASTVSTVSSLATLAPPPNPVQANDYQPRPVSRGSVKSVPSQKQLGMTPDKLRLMKALELRKKQMQKFQDNGEKNMPEIDEDAAELSPEPAVPALPEVEVSPQQAFPENGEGSQDVFETEAEHRAAQYSKADSGISLRCDPKPEAHDEIASMTESVHQSDTVSTADGSLYDDPSLDDMVSEDSTARTPTNSMQLHTPSAANFDSDVVNVPTIVLATSSRPSTAHETDEAAVEPEVPVESESVNASRTSLVDSTPKPEEESIVPPHQSIDVAKRRRGYVEPLQLDVSGNPDDFHSDDDELLDELDGATVEEAKPIMVAKSPIYPNFQRQGSATPAQTENIPPVKSVNIAKFSTDRTAPELKRSPSPPGSVSTAPGSSDSRAGVARNVSSGISKRIAALAEISGREQNGSNSGFPSRPLTPETSNSFLQQNGKDWKSSLKSTARNRPTTFKRQSSRNNVAQNQGPVANLDHASVHSVQHDPTTNRNSVSVTARIIRPQPSLDAEEISSKIHPPDQILQRSTSEGLLSDPSSPNASKTNQLDSSSTLSPVLSQSSIDSRGTTRFHSSGRPRGLSPNADQSPPPPTRKGSTPSVLSTDENTATKEGSRTTRFFKRMSNFGNSGSSKRKSGQMTDKNTSPGLSSTSVYSLAQAAPGNGSRNNGLNVTNTEMPPAVVVGDLNIQFPDSLLWKRRILSIDATGHLVFTPSQTSTSSLSKSSLLSQKRYPLTDFRCPYAPDLDSQELPHSVLFEFDNGTTLQAACEDAATHRKVLGLLKGYWRAWTGAASST